MKHLIGFLSKISYVAIMFWCTDAYCETTVPTSIIDDISPHNETTTDDISNPGDTPDIVIISRYSTKTLCPAGQYVYKCGNYRVGFNWLRGVQSTSDDTDNSALSTKNYYISNDQLTLLQQMRDFFAAKDGTSIRYCENDSCNSNTSDYKDDRDAILNNVCNPFNSNTAVTCAYCPNSANVDASTVKITTENTTAKQTASDWEFHTFADCYTDTFTDSTGTYKYTQQNQTTAEKCFYANTNPEAFNTLQGDGISGFASGTNNTINSIFVPIAHTSLRL